jgi:hypothetical protein
MAEFWDSALLGYAGAACSSVGPAVARVLLTNILVGVGDTVMGRGI